MITLTIDGKRYKAEEGRSVLQVALDAGIDIPHLCYHESLSAYGGCRLCLVEITRGKRTTLTTSCTYPAMEDIVVVTNSEKVRRARKLVMELILPMAPDAPRIRDLAAELGVSESRFPAKERENNGCISCGLCVRVCSELVGAHAITFANRGSRRTVEPPFEEEPESCIGCGACVYVCPTDCIKMLESGDERKIVRWNRTLKMKTCDNCGRPFMPVAQIEFALQRATEPPEPGWFDRCPDCR